jgi:hypothetical protein
MYARTPTIWIFHCQCHENIQGSKIQLSLILNSALDNSSGQLHASATLPPGRNWYTHWIGASVISRATMGNVASCILYFSSISIFWQYMTAYKQQVCRAMWRYDVQCEPKVTLHLYSVNQEHSSEWIVMCLCKQIRQAHASLQAYGCNTRCNLGRYEKCVVLWTLNLCKVCRRHSHFIRTMWGLTRQCFSWTCSVSANWTKARVTNYQCYLFHVLHWVSHIYLHHSRKIGVKMN